MTEKVVSKVSGKKKAEVVIKVDGEGANGSEGMPAAVIKVDGKVANRLMLISCWGGRCTLTGW